MITNSILVLGATGKTGRRLVPHLRAAGATVRAASRSGEVRFDWADESTWSGALDGATAAYLVAPEESEPIASFVQQAVAGGVRRFVVLSGRAADKFGDVFGQSMLAAERAVQATSADWTILRANNFNQNFDEDLFHAPLLAGRLALPAGEVPEPFVDVADIAEVAAVALTEDGHAGQTYDLSGPRALTFEAAAKTIATATGRSIGFVELTSAEYVAELLAEGFPEEAARALAAMFDLMREGHLAEPADGVRRVLGRAPRDFESYVESAAASGAWRQR
ncbi:MAG: NAD(P)H-binding protein [Kibdelosporangium sp.]